MKCPRGIFPIQIGDKIIGWDIMDCMEKECAWWDENNKLCDIRVSAIALDWMHEFMKEIKDKMPHAGQFTK